MQEDQSPAADGQVTLLTPSGYQHGSCGYCKSDSETSRASLGAFSSSLHPLHYQTLVDRGWRRSGTYLYLPDCRHSCCPHYTIRLDAEAFNSTKDQRKAVNRWSRYILGQDYNVRAARLCPRSRQEKKKRRNVFDLSNSVHACEYQNVKKPFDARVKENLEPAHKFEVNLEPDDFTEEKYSLFADYQRNVHQESVSDFSRKSFKRFLCSGMKPSIRRIDGTEQRLGSFHQCYRLDGRLVAMGVLDLLPSCVSSVYLIYHNDVNDWNFGKLSALREIDLASQNGSKFYYMGYYIHSCVKMRYKAAFKPSHVLDLESHTWDSLDLDLLQRMSARQYVSMSREREFQIPLSLPTSLQELKTTPWFNSSHIQCLNSSTLNSLIEYLIPPKSNPRNNSAFKARTPGITPLEALTQSIDLGKWKLKFKNAIVCLEDLVGWQESAYSDPTTIKGLVAELAAGIGAQLVEETVLEF